MTAPNEINNSSKTALRPLLYALMLAAGIGIGMSVNQTSKDKFSQIFDIISRDYVDSTRTDVLAESTIEYLLSQLDPHSSYISPQFTEINEQQIRGNYEGLGIEYISFRDTPCVYNVYAGSPAEKAGIKPGDRLLMAGKLKLTDSLSFKEIRSAMTGEAKSSIAIKVYRRNTNSIIDFNISRDNIVLNSSEVYYMVNSTLGYIQIERFSNNTHKQFVAAMEELKKQGMKDLLIDLRNNGGGLLYEAVAIANEFLQKDEIISYTSGYRRKRHDFIADGNGTFKDGKLVLLINHNTASASEILAGALQDNDRAIIIGNRSFGKGLVQEPFKLSDGSTLRLTIARYYTPSGRSIQKSYDKNIENYRNEIFRRDILKDTLNPVLDSSIKKEFFTKNGRLLTKGGGIRPDITLRDTINDSTEIEQLMPGLFYSRIFDIYLMDYMAGDIEKARQLYKDVYSFQARYSIDKKEVLRFIKVASAIPYLRQLKYSIKTEDIIKKHLKAAIAYRLYGERGKSQIINREEGVFSKTFEVLKNYNRILNIGVKKSRRFDY
ncbi:MAG: S41 family peptidase [Chitinophagaceae bacterium]